MSQNILYEKDYPKHRATITMNRPEKLNSCTTDMWKEITDHFQEAEQDDDIKVVVIRGTGRCFGSGHDVVDLGPHHGWSSEATARRPSQRRRLAFDDNIFWGRRGLIQTIMFCDKATIAQVHGYCYGGHLELALGCDMTIAAPDALFTHPGFRYIGPLGGIAFFIHTMGVKKAKEMMLTGTPLTAPEALACGLVNRVVPLEQLETEVDRVASTIALQPRDAIVLGKANFELALDIIGAGAGYTAGYLSHCLQTNIRYEEDEFNLFKSRKEKGLKGALQEREARYAGAHLAR